MQNKGDNLHISSFKKNFNVGFFSDTIVLRSFKLCLIITLLGVYIVTVGLMTNFHQFSTLPIQIYLWMMCMKMSEAVFFKSMIFFFLPIVPTENENSTA